MSDRNKATLWPERYFVNYTGQRGYAGPNGVLGPWVLPAGFSYTGKVKEGATRAQDGGSWAISYSGSFGPFHPVIITPPGRDHYKYLRSRQRSEGHNVGYAGPGDPPNVPIWFLVHENAAPMNWLESRLKMVRIKLAA